MGSQETLVEKSLESSLSRCSEPFGDFFVELIQRLKAKIVDVDLIQTIEDNLGTLYEIIGLLAQLNKLEAPNFIVNFILDFELFLEKTPQIVRLKNESTKRLGR